MVAVPPAYRLAAPTMRLPLPLVCVVLALGLCRPAAALDLYQASAPLADAGDAARSSAVTTAFGRVLGQVAGRPAAAALAQQPAGRAAAQRALLGFGSKTGRDGEPLIEARFDQRAVREFLAAQHVATLPDQRPTLLLWLLAGTDAGPTWVGADEPLELASMLAQAAADRGLPLLLPVLDLGERADLPTSADPSDPASLAALSTAAARYRPDGVLYGRLDGSGERWRADLRLALPGKDDAVWSATGTSQRAAVDAALDRLALQLAPAAATPDGPLAAVQIAIDGIDGIAAYGRVWEYLGQVPGLRGLRPLALGNGRAMFRFELAGGQAALAGRVEPGAPFTRMAGEAPTYRYQP